MRKLNILYVDFSVGFGGSAISLKNLTNGMSALGHNVIVAFIFHKDESFRDKNLFPAKVKVIFLGGIVTDFFLKISRSLYDSRFLVRTKITHFLMFFVKIFFDRIPTILKLVSLMKKEKVDLLHVNNGISIPIIMSANLAKVPCLISLRSFVNKDIATRKILRKIDYFIANSQAVKKDFMIKSGISETKAKVVYNGVNVDELLNKAGVSDSPVRALYNVKDGQKIIGTAGRLIEWKRQDLLIAAVEKLLQHGIDLKCLIIGAPEKEQASLDYEAKLHEMVRQKGLEQNIIFTGFTEKPLEIMKGLDVFVLPSMIEPFGNVVLESMVFGVPVVAFNDGGPVEIITDGKDGLLVPVGDVDALAGSIAKLLTDEGLRKTMAEEARRKVRDQFSLEKSIQQLDDLYREVAEKKA